MSMGYDLYSLNLFTDEALLTFSYDATSFYKYYQELEERPTIADIVEALQERIGQDQACKADLQTWIAQHYSPHLSKYGVNSEPLPPCPYPGLAPHDC